MGSQPTGLDPIWGHVVFFWDIFRRSWTWFPNIPSIFWGDIQPLHFGDVQYFGMTFQTAVIIPMYLAIIPTQPFEKWNWQTVKVAGWIDMFGFKKTSIKDAVLPMFTVCSSDGFAPQSHVKTWFSHLFITITWGLRTVVWPNSQEFRLLRDGTADGDEAKAQYKRLGRCDLRKHGGFRRDDPMGFHGIKYKHQVTLWQTTVTVCYWKLPFIVSFPIKHGDFP